MSILDPSTSIYSTLVTSWSDGSWLSTVHRLDTHQFETAYFSDRPERSIWRLDRVTAKTPEAAAHNHDLLVGIVNDTNARLAGQPITEGAPRDGAPAGVDYIDVSQPTVAPWADDATSASAGWALEISRSEPPHPARHELSRTTEWSPLVGAFWEKKTRHAVVTQTGEELPIAQAQARWGTPPHGAPPVAAVSAVDAATRRPTHQVDSEAQRMADASDQTGAARLHRQARTYLQQAGTLSREAGRGSILDHPENTPTTMDGSPAVGGYETIRGRPRPNGDTPPGRQPPGRGITP